MRASRTHSGSLAGQIGKLQMNVNLLALSQLTASMYRKASLAWGMSKRVQ